MEVLAHEGQILLREAGHDVEQYTLAGRGDARV